MERHNFDNVESFRGIVNKKEETDELTQRINADLRAKAAETADISGGCGAQSRCTEGQYRGSELLAATADARAPAGYARVVVCCQARDYGASTQGLHGGYYAGDVGARDNKILA